ncbi:MAG: glycosyltransferase family 39 protein [Candidatus Aenigmatarchaeota archaeon]
MTEKILSQQKKLFSADILIFFVLFSFLLLRIIFFSPVFSDETIYINMAKALREGLLPYRDFFYAHPPVQLLLLAPIAFTNSFIVVKIFISIVGVVCIIFTYLIAKELFGEKPALMTSLAFLFFPGFLIFGNLAMGTFETLLFFLPAFYFLLHKKTFLSNVFLTLAIFTRYLTILLFPLLIVYIIKYQRKELHRFLSFFILMNLLVFLFLYISFRFKFINFTLLYHFQTNIRVASQPPNLIWQYLSLGFFSASISLITLIHSQFEKNYKLFLFSLYPLIYDSSVLLILKQVTYHYFAFVLPFIFIAFGEVVVKSKFCVVKLSLFLILLLSILTNLHSLSFYFDKNKNLVLKELLEYTFRFTEKDDLIFGSAIPTNYLSFVANRKIVGNYFDSDLKHINFEGKEKVINEVRTAKPKLIIADKAHEDFYRFFYEDYEIVKEWENPGYYHLVLMKKK